MQPFRKKLFYGLHRTAKFISLGVVLGAWFFVIRFLLEQMEAGMEWNAFVIGLSVGAFLGSYVLGTIFSGLLHVLINRFFGLPGNDEVPNISLIGFGHKRKK